MRKKSSLEPEFYLPNKSHPLYPLLQFQYVMRHDLPSSTKQERRIARYEKANWPWRIPKELTELRNMNDVPAYYLKKINDCLKQTEEVNKEAVAYVIEAIKWHGASVLRLSRLGEQHLADLCSKFGNAGEPDPLAEDWPDWKKYQYLKSMNLLGRTICEIIVSLEKDARSGNLESKKTLTEIARALIPDTRGKKKNDINVSKDAIAKFYYMKLFCLYHIENALCSPTGPRNPSLKVKAASKNFEIPVELIREFWGLGEDDRPYRQRLTLKDMARELTARRLKITHQAVSNILAS